MSRAWIAAVLGLVGLVLGCEDGAECPLDCGGMPIVFPCIEVLSDSTAATVVFSVDARGAETLCECEYTSSPGGWSLSDSVLAGAAWGPRQMTLRLSPLEPETRYSYRLRAVNCVGSVTTEVDSFETVRLNLFPDTFVTGMPPEAVPGGGCSIHVLWFGVDADGTVDHFEWTRSDGDPPGVWRSTACVDSGFVVGAGFSGEWVFSVRAVDNDGGIDRSPAHHVVTLGAATGRGR
jgi:hypothetical protein